MFYLESFTNNDGHSTHVGFSPAGVTIIGRDVDTDDERFELRQGSASVPALIAEFGEPFIVDETFSSIMDAKFADVLAIAGY